jgi:arginine utilization regulatory protein
LAERIARTRHSVLIEGEPGTGRRLLASFLHARGPQAEARFVALDCRTIAGRQNGRSWCLLDEALQRPAGGTVFLQNVEWLDDFAQGRLLVALRDRQRHSRVVMSTSADPVGQANRWPLSVGRLGALPLFLPPLRERRRDIPLLAEHFVAAWCESHAARRICVDEPAMLALWQRDWPGNIGELREEIEGALWRARDGVIRVGDLKGYVAVPRRERLPVASFESRDALPVGVGSWS